MKPESCHWDSENVELVGNKARKVRQYLREDLIRCGKLSGQYVVYPTKGRYQVHTVDVLAGTCTCQAFNTMGVECSHMLAVALYNKKFLRDEKR